MSDDYTLIALGREDFVLPYGMTGLQYYIASNQAEAEAVMESSGHKGIIYILDEDIIDDITGIEEKEDANILVVKAWGKSASSMRRIRQASIKAMGVDLTRNRN